MFNALSRKDLLDTQKIAHRYCSLIPGMDKLQIAMDVSAVKQVAKSSKPRINCNLGKLLESSDKDFLHDVLLFREYLNRGNGSDESLRFDFDLICPRFMRKEKKSV